MTGDEPKTPWHELLVALSGPAVTVLLVMLFGLGLGSVHSLTEVQWGSTEGLLYLPGGSHATAGLAALLYYLAMINTVLLVPPRVQPDTRVSSGRRPGLALDCLVGHGQQRDCPQKCRPRLSFAIDCSTGTNHEAIQEHSFAV